MTITDADICLHCRLPEYRHVLIAGAGKLCPVSVFAFQSKAAYDRAAEARAREEGAKAMQEAALNALELYFCGCGASIFDDGCCEVDQQPADDLDYYSAPDALAALDPAQIAGGGK